MPEYTEMNKAVSDEALRIEEDSLYSARGHWEAAKLWSHAHMWLGIPLTICAATAGFSVQQYPTFATGLAFAVAAGTALMTFLSPQQRHQGHADAGNAYKALNNQARIFRCVECASGKPLEELQDRLKELDARRNMLNTESPLIPRRAFVAARRGIEQGEAHYLADRKYCDKNVPGA